MFQQELEQLVRFLGEETGARSREAASRQAREIDEVLTEWRIENVKEVLRRSTRLLGSPKRVFAALGAATTVAAGGVYPVDHLLSEVRPSIVEAREAEQELFVVRSELDSVDKSDRYVQLVGIVDPAQSSVDEVEVVIVPGIAGSFLRMNGGDNPNLFRNIYYGRDDEGRVFRLPSSTNMTAYGDFFFRSEYLAFGTGRNGEIIDLLQDETTGKILGFVLGYKTRDEDGNETIAHIPTFISAVADIKDADDDNRKITPEEFLEMLPELVGNKRIGFCANEFLVRDYYDENGDVFNIAVLFDAAISGSPEIESICRFDNPPQFEPADLATIYHFPFQVDIDPTWKNRLPMVAR